MKTLVPCLALAVLALAACSSSDDSTETPDVYEGLYATPQAATTDPNEIVGLWEAPPRTTDGIDYVGRIEFRGTTIKFANRCMGSGYETVTVGVTVNATFADGTVRLADAGGSDVKRSSGPTGKPPLRCLVQLTGPGTTSYSLGVGKLVIFDVSFTKVTD